MLKFTSTYRQIIRLTLIISNLSLIFLVEVIMESDDGEKETESEVAELRLKVVTLKQELKECRAELIKVQKQLNQSERLQRSTESYNEDLRKQVCAYSIHQITQFNSAVMKCYMIGWFAAEWV